MNFGENLTWDFGILGLDLKVDVSDVINHLGEFDKAKGGNVAREARVFDGGELGAEFFGGHEENRDSIGDEVKQEIRRERRSFGF